MTVYGKFGLFRKRWLTLHQLAALVMVANALVMLVPIGRAAVEAAAAIAAGNTAEALAALMAKEHVLRHKRRPRGCRSLPGGGQAEPRQILTIGGYMDFYPLLRLLHFRCFLYNYVPLMHTQRD